MNQTTASDETPPPIEDVEPDAQTAAAVLRESQSAPAVAKPQPQQRADNDDDDRDDEDEDDDDEEDADGNSDGPPRRGGRSQAKLPPREPQANRFADVVSGQFDADEEDEQAPVLKRVLLPQVETPKLHKVLAQAGLGSRLEMEQLIMEGRISVNNEPAHIGQRIQFGDQVKVNGKPIRFRIDPPPARVIAYHKPVGEVVTNDDPQNRPTVFRKLPKLVQGKWQSVGRLDLNTEGLLLFTSSGELANKLMHPRFGLEREYAVRVLGALSNEEKQRLLDGVKLDDGMAQFGSIEEGGGEGSNCWYRVTISEGRNREVRRMFEAVGHAVSRLIRIRYGAMVLPRGLKRGAWMELDERDIQALVRAASGGQQPGRSAEGDAGESRDSRQGRGGRKRADGTRGPGPRGSGNGQRRNRGDGGGGGGGNNAGRGQGGRNNNGNNAARGDREDRLPGGAQPDPMKTAFGYIGADSFTRQRQGPGQGGQRRGGNSGGGGGGGGGQRRGGGGRGR
jgi:23S rRNA pseudouridine2605 synthase